MPSRTSRKGMRPRLVGWHRSSSGVLADSPGQGHRSLGPLRARRGVDPACETYSISVTRRLVASASMSSRISAASTPFRHHHLGDRSPSCTQEFADGLAALDLLTPESHRLRPPADGTLRPLRSGPRPRSLTVGRPGDRSRRTPPGAAPAAGILGLHPCFLGLCGPWLFGAPRAPPFGAGVRERFPLPPLRCCRTHRTSPLRPGTGRPVSTCRPARGSRVSRTTAVQAIPPRPDRGCRAPSARVALTLTGALSSAPPSPAPPCGRRGRRQPWLLRPPPCSRR